MLGAWVLARGSLARASALLLHVVTIAVTTPLGADFDRVREAIRAVAVAGGCNAETVVMARWTEPGMPMVWYVECDTPHSAAKETE